MIDANELSRFRKTITLRNGATVLIRAARADDRQRLVAAFQGLDRQTIYTRYFSFRKSISPSELDRLDEQDSGRYILLVATLGSGSAETIIAGASCVVADADGPIRSAECAFTVEEDYQRQGLASQLLATIVELAHRQGIGRLEADVLAENQAMLAVFKRCGLPMTLSRSGGIVHLVLQLPSPPPEKTTRDPA